MKLHDVVFSFNDNDGELWIVQFCPSFKKGIFLGFTVHVLDPNNKEYTFGTDIGYRPTQAFAKDFINTVLNHEPVSQGT